MLVNREKFQFTRSATLVAVTLGLAATGITLPVGCKDGDVVMSAAYAVGNDRGNGGVGNGNGRGDANGRNGQSDANADGGQGHGSSPSGGAAGRGSLNSANASNEGLTHAHDASPVGALNNYMESMVDYAAAVENRTAAEQAKQNYLDGLPAGVDPDEEIVAELDRAIADAQGLVDDSLNAAAKSLLDAANKEDLITEDLVDKVNQMLDGKSEGFTDPQGHIDESPDEIVDTISKL